MKKERKINMKTIFAILLISTIILGAYIGITEYEATEELQPVALSVVAVNRMSLPMVRRIDGRILPVLYDACYSYGETSVFTSESETVNRSNLKMKKPDEPQRMSVRSRKAMSAAMDILDECLRTKASSEEVDTLRTVTLAAERLQKSALTDKRMLVYESGLCTTGLLNMLSGEILEMTPEEIVEMLREEGALPDLTGVSVNWIGLGAAAGKQERIPGKYKDKLEALWKAVITASGGEVEFDMKPVRCWEARGLPKVSVVEFEKE